MTWCGYDEDGTEDRYRPKFVQGRIRPWERRATRIFRHCGEVPLESLSWPPLKKIFMAIYLLAYTENGVEFCKQ